MKKKISQISDIKSGFLFKKGLNSHLEGNLQVIQLKDLDDRGILKLNQLQRIKLENIDPKNFLTNGDVLFKAKTNRPVAGVVKESLTNAIATAHYFVISVKNKTVLPDYLAWYLNQRPAQIYFSKNSGGTRIQVVNKQTLGELEIMIPALTIQENIVKVAQLYQKEQELLENIKEEKLKLIAAQLLTAVKSNT